MRPRESAGPGAAYECNPAPHGTHMIVADEIGRDRFVLDVGCNRGYLKRLCHPSNRFHGLDADPEAVDRARAQGYELARVADLNVPESLELDDVYDTMVMADVLEHLLHPQAVLGRLLGLVADTGRVIVSLPNVAHLSVRLPLLMGRFDYTETGILDRTHLHFYTLETARRLLRDAGLRIVRERYSSNRFGPLLAMFPMLAPLLAYTFIFVCHKDGN